MHQHHGSAYFRSSTDDFCGTWLEVLFVYNRVRLNLAIFYLTRRLSTELHQIQYQYGLNSRLFSQCKMPFGTANLAIERFIYLRNELKG